MNFNFGNLVSAAVGAVSKVANAVVNALSPVAKGGGLFGGIAGAVIGAAIAVANVCEDGEIDEDEIEEILANVVKVYVGATMAMFGSGSSRAESKSGEDINSLPKYDPLSARLKENKGTRVRKIGGNGEYFPGTIDEFGNFIPDDLEGFSDNGYKAYRESMYDYAKTHKTTEGTYATNYQIDGYNVHYGPMKYKSEAFRDYCNHRFPVKEVFAQIYTQSAINNGFNPEESKIWGDIYGDFSEGMLFETGATISIAGAKSFARGFSYDRDIVAGSGAGNLNKTSYVKSSDFIKNKFPNEPLPKVGK